MKILHIPHAYAPVIGGAEVICKSVSDQMVHWGHQVQVVTADVGAVQGYYEFGIPRVHPPSEVINGVFVKRLSFCNSLYRLGGLLQNTFVFGVVGKRAASRSLWLLRRRLTYAVAREIATRSPDVVMTMPHLVINVLTVLAAKRQQQFPLVMVPMLHEHDPQWSVSAMADALQSADAVIAMTDYEIERLVEAYHVPREKIFLGSAGIDPDESIHWDARPRRVVFLGRKTRSKGIDLLIDAMRLVWQEIPDAELYLAGIRVPETKAIDDQVAALPVSWRRQVWDLDQVSDEQKILLLRSAYCVVLPSRTESFGMVLLDAWAHGTPVVVWDFPVFRGIVAAGIDGVLADPARPTSLAEAILQLLRAPTVAEQMGRTGHAKVKCGYSWESVATRYLQAYEYAIRHCPVVGTSS